MSLYVIRLPNFKCILIICLTVWFCRDVASEMKLLLDAAGRLAPQLPEQQRAELDLARRKLLETSRSFSNALKGYFKEPQ